MGLSSTIMTVLTYRGVKCLKAPKWAHKGESQCPPEATGTSGCISEERFKEAPESGVTERGFDSPLSIAFGPPWEITSGEGLRSRLNEHPSTTEYLTLALEDLATFNYPTS